jgi:hypothetical protein
MVRDVTRSQSGAPYFTGPFVVLRCTAARTYTLLTPDGSLFHRNVPRKDLKVISGAPLVDLADLDSVDRTYLIERIVDHRVAGNDTEFRVQWKGYEEQTWEPSANFVGVGDAALREYWNARDLAPRPPSVAPPVDLPLVVDPIVPAPSVSPVISVSVVPAVAPVTRLGRVVRAPAHFDSG